MLVRRKWAIISLSSRAWGKSISLCCACACAQLCVLMKQKLCALGMFNAILRNHLKLMKKKSHPILSLEMFESPKISPTYNRIVTQNSPKIKLIIPGSLSANICSSFCMTTQKLQSDKRQVKLNTKLWVRLHVSNGVESFLVYSTLRAFGFSYADALVLSLAPA